MARPSKARERRAELVVAARRAISERGVLELRLRDVAEQAGVSSASILYYFPSLTDLLRDVQQEAVERFCADREARARAVADPRRQLVAMIDAGLPTGPDDELCVLLLELSAMARRDATYAAGYVRLYERQVGIYTTIIEAGTASGAFAPALPARVIARNLVALEDGYGLHMTMAAPTMPVDEARRQLIGFAADATRCALEETP